MPRRLSLIQQDILEELCKENDISFISSANEQDRIKKILKEAYDIIIVGNVGQLNKIILPEAIAVMVYHGIGLKQSYYTYNQIASKISDFPDPRQTQTIRSQFFGSKHLFLCTPRDQIQDHFSDLAGLCPKDFPCAQQDILACTLHQCLFFEI